MKRKTRNIFLILGAAILASCSGKGGEKADLSHSEEIKLEQYLVAGQQLFIQHCSSCHQTDGQGLAQLFPPLNKSDYLDNHLDSVACIIHNGLSGDIVVNGVTYNQPMPAIPQLTALDIAEITTYIFNSWGREHGIIGVKEIEKKLEQCK